MKATVFGSCALVSLANVFSVFPNSGQAVENARPNIVWFLTEDLSPFYLSMFNNGKGAETPNVEWMARNGLTYTNAYSNAPVSSAARTTLITGCYAPRFAGSFHRRLQKMELPEGLRMFPSYLREAGYFTCNAQKTDYNVRLDTTAWDNIKGEIDTWRSRPDKSKPFFLQRSNMMTHESRLQFDENTYNTVATRHNPEDVYLHPSHPDTKLMRYTYATFYDKIEDSDNELGKLIAMLREEGELDNTFIFYFGDNGGTLPGTKGYTDDIGIHVPLVVYIPEKWRDRLGVKENTVVTDLVSFMDFAPTVLKLAGVDIPEQMDGEAFLGNEKKQDFVVGYGDRFDELYSFNRTIRKGKYRYARNFVPYHTQSLFAFYRYKQLAFREWKDLYNEGSMNSVQNSFFLPFGTEELYDLEADPCEQKNLINDPEYRDVVKDLRSTLNTYLVDKADLGFFPETVILEEGKPNQASWGNSQKARIQSYLDIADLELGAYTKDTEARITKALGSSDPVDRLWALTVCASRGKDAVAMKSKAYGLLKDERAFVRGRAMVFLSVLGERFTKDDVMNILGSVKTGAETLFVLNDLTFMYENGLISPFGLKMNELKKKCTGVDWRLKYLNSYVNANNWPDRWKLIFDGNE